MIFGEGVDDAGARARYRARAPAYNYTINA